MRIAIRADASVAIGTGHVMRCLALANELRARGAETAFVCRHLPEPLASSIRAQGHQIIHLPSASPEPMESDAPAHGHWLGASIAQDATQTLEALSAEAGWDWLVVDHYALDARWETALRARCRKIMVIDDLADRSHDCDLLLDQNHYLDSEARYRELVPAQCRLLLGPRFALLRPDFGTIRQSVAPRDGSVRRVLVFFGGIDPGNATGTALEALSRLTSRWFDVDVVIGAGHPFRSGIEFLCAREGFRCHVQTSEMACLMASADLALGAGGTATWERCALGLPAIVLCLADNQRALIRDGAETGLLYAPDIEPCDMQRLLIHIQAVLDNSALRSLISRTSLAMTDTSGAKRIAQMLLCSGLALRRAQATDCVMLLSWRNHPNVREVSRSTEPIDRATHEQWFKRVLSDPNRPLLIGMLGGDPVGVVRFDLNRDGCEVSIYVAPDKHGASLGMLLLLSAEQWLAREHPEVKTIRAEVLRDNKPSHQLFSRCGYQLETTHYRKEITS